MRLTVDLINESLSYLNPLKERELDLRGHRIPAIENLGAAKEHDAIDFTDNDIQVLGNFPAITRLQTLLLARNRVSSIQPALAESIPNLTNLVLSSNSIAELADVDALGRFPRLTHLVLADNPITKKEHYRYWVIWRCPSVRFLDYAKVKDAEREKGRELFGTVQEPTGLQNQILGQKSKAFDISSKRTAAPSKLSRIKMNEEERSKLKERIKNATSLQEVLELEKMLKEGRLPSGVLGDAMEE